MNFRMQRIGASFPTQRHTKRPKSYPIYKRSFMKRYAFILLLVLFWFVWWDKKVLRLLEITSHLVQKSALMPGSFTTTKTYLEVTLISSDQNDGLRRTLKSAHS